MTQCDAEAVNISGNPFSMVPSVAQGRSGANLLGTSFSPRFTELQLVIANVKASSGQFYTCHIDGQRPCSAFVTFRVLDAATQPIIHGIEVKL
jgi:hypothetical protein